MGGFSTLGGGGGLTWNEIKSKLETEGAKNKAYDVDLDSIIDLVAIPTLPPDKLDAVDTPADGEFPSYKAGKFEWIPAADAGWGLMKVLEVTANTTSFTIDGLDGDTDKMYMFDIFLINPTGSSVSYYMRPNGVTSGLSAILLYAVYGNPPNSSSEADALVATTASYCIFRILWWCKTGTRRFAWEIRGCGCGTPGNPAIDVHALEWTDTTTNITSFELVANATNGIGAGTIIRVYKPRW